MPGDRVSVARGPTAATIRPSLSFAASAMKYSPDFATFSKLAAGLQLVPVYRRLLGDALTPVSAFHKIDFGPTACLFESVIGGEKVGRDSFLAANPFLQIEARG